MYWLCTAFCALAYLFAMPFMQAQTQKNAPLDVSTATYTPIDDFCSDETGAMMIEGLEENSFQRQDLIIATTNQYRATIMDKADFDNDGDMDIVTGTTGSEVLVLENMGGGNFNTRIIYSAPINEALFVKAIDMDGDGDMDIVYDSRIGDILWFENIGNLSFNVVPIGTAGDPNWKGLDFWDYDNDGDMDVFASDGDIYQLTNPGNTTAGFTKTALGIVSNLGEFKLLDVDLDGDPDIIGYQSSPGGLILLRNNGSQNYSGIGIINFASSGGGITTRIEVGDLNNDGYPDCAVGAEFINFSTGQRLYELRNNQNGTFVPISRLGTINSNTDDLTSIAIGDLDNEGNLDIVASIDGRDYLEILYNDGTGGFHQRQTTDVVNKGDDDLLIGQFKGNKNREIISSATVPVNGLHLYENTTLITNPLSLDYNLGGETPTNFSVENIKVNGIGKATGEIQLSPGNHNPRFFQIRDCDNNVGAVNFRDMIYVNDANVEIKVSGNGIDITDDDNSPSTMDNTDFGTIDINTTETHTFSIANGGSVPFTLRNTPPISVNASEFTVAVTNVAINGTVTFEITYQPTATGTHTAEVEILSNDCDETLYNFALTGTAVVPLPISLSQFTAKATTKNQVELNWKTELETNAAGFFIEWSKDGQQWQELDFIAAEHQANHYQYLHKTPNNGDNYYRLQLVDLDKSYAYSTIQNVYLNVDDFNTHSLFYPNPASDILNVTFPSHFDEEQVVQISIYAPTGQLIQELETVVGQSLNVDNLGTGLYFITLQQGSLQTGERVMILK